MNRLAVLAFFVTTGLMACGKTPLYIGHDLDTAPSHKLTDACATARTDAQTELAQQKGVANPSKDITNMFLPGGQCGVKVMVDSNESALPVLQRLKGKFGFYTQIPEKGGMVKVWEDEPSAPLPIVHDKDGHVIDSLATLPECQAGTVVLAEARLNATFTVIKNADPAVLADHCYIEADFHDDASFEKFFAWKSPSGELLHLHQKKLSGATSNVRIHVLRAN